MRATRMLATSLLLAIGGFAVGPGCKDATQATLEIKFLDAKKELCPKTGGTAIAVGVDRDATERVISSYVTAETRDCDAASGFIGSLVVTPSDDGHAAIVVAVAFDTARAASATACKPPAYAGCIVARRYFAFSSHKNLRLPITIDPDCLDVPCNATSTCRKGHCYDSRSDDGTEPGDDGQGGAKEAGIVDGAVDGFTPDGSRPDGALPDGSPDGALPDGTLPDGPPGDANDGGGLDGTLDGGAPPPPECRLNILYCNSGGTLVQCSGGGAKECCNTTVPGECTDSISGTCNGKPKLCCVTADCPVVGESCQGATPTAPGQCLPSGIAPPTCQTPSGPLLCPGPSCDGPNKACCSNAAMPPFCTVGADACPAKSDTQWCCRTQDCTPGKLCPMSIGTDARICQGGIDGK